MSVKEHNEIYQLLIEQELFTENELNLVTCINGYNMETLNDCAYARYGVRTANELIFDDDGG